MAFHGHLSQDMYGDQHLGDTTSAVLRTIVVENQTSSYADAIETKAVLRTNEEDNNVDGSPSIATDGPTWLMRRQNNHPHPYPDGSFLHLQTTSDSSASPIPPNRWLPSIGAEEEVNVPGDSMIASVSQNITGSNQNQNQEGQGGGLEVNWQNARYKAEILSHPLYEQLLSAHVACLRVATPVDQLPRVDAQLEQSQNVVARYSVLGQQHSMTAGDDKELDHFMVGNKSSTSFFRCFPPLVQLCTDFFRSPMVLISSS